MPNSKRRIAVAAALVLLPAPALAKTLVDQRGTRLTIDGAEVADNQKFQLAAFAGSSDPAPFDVLIGADDSVGPNFSASWSHDFGRALGTVSAATIEIGLYDDDARVAVIPGFQVERFAVNGADIAVESMGVFGSKRYLTERYSDYVLTLPNSVLASFSSGFATFELRLRGQGLIEAVNDNRTPFNGAVLDFARLTVTFDPAAPPGVPEPGSWATMIAGFGIAGMGCRRRKLAMPRA